MLIIQSLCVTTLVTCIYLILPGGTQANPTKSTSSTAVLRQSRVAFLIHNDNVSVVSDHIFEFLCYHIGYTNIQSRHIGHVYNVVLGDPFRVMFSH